MGLATIDSHSLKELTEIHKIPKFGVNQASFHWDTAIWKCQNLQRNIWQSGCCPTQSGCHTFLCKFTDSYLDLHGLKSGNGHGANEPAGPIDYCTGGGEVSSNGWVAAPLHIINRMFRNEIDVVCDGCNLHTSSWIWSDSQCRSKVNAEWIASLVDWSEDI